MLGNELGRGGMGIVRTGWQVPLGREVAVKQLKASAGDKAEQALVDEAAITGALEHPNIPPVHFLGRDDGGRPLLVMKRIDGVAWSALLDDEEHPRWRSVVGSRLDWNLGVLMQVANAVHFAHTHGFVHRDLKPENVMLGEFGEIYVLDWGIAARIDALATKRQEAGRAELVGTPAYVAPEMIDMRVGPVGRRTDVYLLGGILYHVLTGRPPHGGKTLLEALLETLDAKPIELGDDVPRVLGAICKRALAPDPDDRFSSAEELRAALVDFLQTRDSVRNVARANESLKQLREMAKRTDGDRVEIYRVFDECRFAFEEARRLQPDLSLASEGIVDVLTVMANLEIKRGNPDGAELLLADLKTEGADDDTRSQIAGQIEAQRARDAAVAAEHEKLKSEEADRDLRPGSRTRAYVALGLMALFVLGGQVAVVQFQRPAAASRVGLVISLVVVGLVMRKTLLGNTANRQLSLAVFVLACAAPLHLVVTWQLGLEHQQLLPVDLLLLSIGLALIAIMLDRRTTWSAVLALTGALASAWFERHMYEIVAATLVVVAGAQVVLWGYRAPGD